MASILIIRFSALGDVAMTVPVIDSFARQYPEHRITVLSDNKLSALFGGLPSNCSFWGADLKGKHRGIKGLNALFETLYRFRFDHVADFHDVLRTKYLRLRFWLKGSNVAHINKGREEKRRLVRRFNKDLRPLLSSFERYRQVLEKLGFPFDMDFVSIFQHEGNDTVFQNPLLPVKGGRLWLGIAPFAKHKGKVYPGALTEEVIAHFACDDRFSVFLFGGGKKEEDLFIAWKKKYPALILPEKRLGLSGELALMSRLDLMLSMDSANMHFASLAGVPVVSVWGATHPYAGFMGWRQPEHQAIQVELSCRPCSVFGNRPCFRKDYACLNLIQPEVIIEKIEDMLAPPA